jgi:hypothetical protein
LYDHALKAKLAVIAAIPIMSTVPGPGWRTFASTGIAVMAAAAAHGAHAFLAGGATTRDNRPRSDAWTSDSFRTSTDAHFGQLTLMGDGAENVTTVDLRADFGRGTL